MTPTIRLATSEDAEALAGLKLADLTIPPGAAERAAYVGRLRSWMRERDDRVVCAIAFVEGELVGMAWLVIFERVPNLDAPTRLSGDVQSVWVEPEHRGRGLGRRLIEWLIHEADAAGIPRVTVHSGRRAVPFYERLGFESAPVLLQRERG